MVQVIFFNYRFYKWQKPWIVTGWKRGSEEESKNIPKIKPFYSQIDQVKFTEDSLQKFWTDLPKTDHTTSDFLKAVFHKL